MKKIAIALTLLSFHLPAMAAPSVVPVNCKKFTEAVGQGYEVVETGMTLQLIDQGKVVANLIDDGKSDTPAFGDKEAMKVFRQNVVNGYMVKMFRGGLAPRTWASVLHGGVAGFTEQAVLDDCK